MGKPMVLYVEDEKDDVFFIRLAFKAAGLGEALQSVGDGGKAITYLAGRIRTLTASGTRSQR